MAPSFNQQTTGLEVVKAFPERTTNKTFIITGTTPNSIGSATALALAHGSPKALFLTGRSLPKIQPVITEINEINPEIKVIYVEMDLSDLDSVRKAAAFVLSCKEADEVHGLINNAGICCTMPFAVNKAGVEMQFATNHIGHFLFTNLILPRLLAGAASPNAHPRITVVASTGYTLSNVLFSDLNFQNGKTYNPWIAYGSSKTANILFSTYLSEHLKGKGIESFAVQPGMPRTALYKDIKETGITSIEEAGRILTEKYGASGANPSGDMSGDVKTIEDACSTPLAAALDPEFDGRSGLFLRNCQPFEVEPWAKDVESAERLWKMTEEMVGEKFVI